MATFFQGGQRANGLGGRVGGGIMPNQLMGPGPGDPNPRNKKLGKDMVLAYTQSTGNVGTPLVQVQEEDPLFYDSNQFNNYYRNKTVSAFDPQTKAVWDSLPGRGDQDAWIAAKGGLPNFDMYQRAVRSYEKTQIPDGNSMGRIAASSGPVNNPTQGYRYGKGLPDKESITRRRKRRR